MAKEDLIKELNVLFSAYLESKNLELIDLVHRQTGAKLILTVLANRQDGAITLQECASLCRQLKNLLEEKNIIAGDYVLEVASPGLDRALKNKKDFSHSLNKEVVFFLNDLVDGACQWQGVISKVDEVVVFVQVTDKILEIPLININKAQLVI